MIDPLNTAVVTRHHYAAYDFFSSSLTDYVRHGIYPHKVGTSEFGTILKIQHPYMYRQRKRLKLPKYVINTSGDQFFLPDNSQYYFAELPQEKLLRYVPNSRHDLGGGNVRDNMFAFYDSMIHERQGPSYTWKIRRDGSIVAYTKNKPIAVNLWRVANPKA